VDDTFWALLILILIISIVPLACVALAVVLDTRSRRGYALGALALATLVLDLRASSAIYWQEDLTLPGLTFVIVFGGLSVALMLTLGAIAETLIARQWWWLGVVVIVSVVPALLSYTPSGALMRSLLDTLGLPVEAGYLVALLPPALVAFAYAMARSIRRPLAG
jgi:hypothetical protein